MEKLEKWEEHADLSSQSDENQDDSNNPYSLFKNNTGSKVKKDADRTSIKHRLRSRKRSKSAKIASKNRSDNAESSSDFSETKTPFQPKIKGQIHHLQHKPKGQDQQSQDKYQGKSRIETWQYCSQKCLLGLVRKFTLDGCCPNVSQHWGTDNYHAISMHAFTALVKMQLDKNLDQDCKPLGQQGARGALFKIRLASHGYVFVAKGTIREFVPNLMHEGQVYQHLKHVQGIFIPVLLGNIDLAKRYYLDFEVRIVHMLLMSWGGMTAEEDSKSEAEPSRRNPAHCGRGISSRNRSSRRTYGKRAMESRTKLSHAHRFRTSGIS